MANVKAAMEYAQTVEREAMKKRVSETGSSDLKALTLIDVVAKHEQEIQELKRLVTPISMNYEEGYEAGYEAGMDENEKREWVGLTDEEKQNAYLKIDSWDDCVNFIEAKLKQKNGGDSAIDKELQRLGYPL